MKEKTKQSYYFQRKDAKRPRSQKRITPKVKKLVKTYIETESPTKAGLAAYNTTNKETARSIAYETLRKPHVKEYMQKLLDKHISDDELLTIHVRNIKQTENLAVSQKAVESFEVLKGLTVKDETEKTGHVTVNLVNFFPNGAVEPQNDTNSPEN